ncbi:hypothetical protein CC86DRAFT_281657, partial [Ophiobolus disseminans]
RNQQESPFLRLPGELRNRVYHYALSDVVLSVYRSGTPPTYLQVIPHSASAAASKFAVCRQVHAETHLLLFQLTTFLVYSDGSFAEFVNHLTDAQRHALAIVQISTQDANVGGKLWHSVTQFPGSDDAAQTDHLDLLEWAHHLAFDQLPGLKRVLVEEESQWTYVGDRDAMLRAGVAYGVKDRDVEIVLPRSESW